MDVTGNISERPIQFMVDVATLRRGEAPTRERWIRMLASTPDLDRQNERVHPGGMDLAYHLAAGFFTDEHDIRVRDPNGKLLDVIPAAHIGEPRPLPGEKSALTMTESGPVITGVLYVGDAAHGPACRCDGCRADRWWFLIETLERSGAHRRVQASVDGKVVRRTRNPDNTADVWECDVADVALTLNAINPKTWVEIVKSMRAWMDDTARFSKASPRPETNPIQRYETSPGVISEAGAVRYLMEQRHLGPDLARWTAQQAFARRAA